MPNNSPPATCATPATFPEELPQRIGELDKFKSRPVIVVCQTGTQANRAEAC
jgi:rhodanese-related sulfurtransferase